MVAQYFPPAGGVGTFRVTKFVKYLRQYDWDPIVLTVAPEYYMADGWPIDNSLLKDLPKDLSIFRTKIMQAGPFNDPGIRWLPYLLFRMKEILKLEKPDLIYLTGDPFIPLLAAPLLQYIRSYKYIIDLRDPWKLAQADITGRSLKQRLGSELSRFVEPLVLRSSSKIICVSEQMCNAYRKEYPEIASDRFAVITNGFDPDDFEFVTPKQFSEATIVYTGKFITGEGFRNPTTIFQALKKLDQQGIRIRFVHVGAIEQQVVDIADNLGVSAQIEFVGWRPYHEALAYAKGADILLVIGGGQLTEQTGKIFDYIACNRPILALANQESEISRIVKSLPYFILLEKPSDDDVAEAIIKILDHGLKDHREWSRPSIYDRKKLTERLSSIFNEVNDEEG